MAFLHEASVNAVAPEVRVTWNSAIPYSANDGPLWAGRGWNVSVSGGASADAQYRASRIHVAVAPTLVYSENLPFQVIPSTAPNRSGYANPFHDEDSHASLDLPLRFGDRPLVRLYPGLSHVSLTWRDATIGATAESEWWGPGIRNAIIMSSNAPGIPRFFVRTREPLRTRLGFFDAELISGILTQSLFFSSITNENRTVSGLRVQLNPAFDTTLTFGFERVVYAAVGPYASPFLMTLSRSFDALFRWENLAGTGNQRSDQIGALFTRWVIPSSGLEVYGEWARMDLPRNATELLTAPNYSGGWTFGFQWAQRKQEHGYLRLQSEVTYLEQSRVLPDRPTVDFYSGQSSPQGYTQEGQIIGAAIGPGGSSQWILLDWIAPGWQVGPFVGRIRWDNDALYRQPATYFAHDVSLMAGLRAAWRSHVSDFTLEVTTAHRLNYLFQNGIGQPGVRPIVDVHNLTVSVAATPR